MISGLKGIPDHPSKRIAFGKRRKSTIVLSIRFLRHSICGDECCCLSCSGWRQGCCERRCEGLSVEADCRGYLDLEARDELVQEMTTA